MRKFILKVTVPMGSGHRDLISTEFNESEAEQLVNLLENISFRGKLSFLRIPVKDLGDDSTIFLSGDILRKSIIQITECGTAEKTKDDTI